MIKFEVILDKRALEDIRPAIEYYNSISERLGTKFETVLDEYFSTLKINPYFQCQIQKYQMSSSEKISFHDTFLN